MPKTITFNYLNHRGARSERTVDVETVEFIRAPGYGYQSGWFVSGFDHDKMARRSFALSHILMPDDTPPPFFTLLQL